MQIGLNYKKNAKYFKKERYSVTVFRDSQSVWFEVETSVEDSTERGGSVYLPVEVANRLGHALVLMSSGKDAGVPESITFKVDEKTRKS